MKSITARELNRRTASLLDAVEKGEVFELRRGGRAVAYLSQAPPVTKRKHPNWRTHFQWLSEQPASAPDLLSELDTERKRLRKREADMSKGL